MKTGYYVADIMKKRPIVVGPKTTVLACAQLMAKKGIGTLLIAENQKLLGIVSEQDLVRKIIALDLPYTIPVQDIMVRRVHTIAPTKDVYDALLKMKEHSVRHLPVVSKGTFIGLITMHDILTYVPHVLEIILERADSKQLETKYELPFF